MLNELLQEAVYPKSEIPRHRAIVLSIFGCSGLLSAIILVIAFLKKVHKTLLSEFMMYIVGGEVISSFLKLLSFSRSYAYRPYESFEYETTKIIQLYLVVLTDTCTIFTSLVISLKIYDGIVLHSRLFKQGKYQKIFRGLIFTVPLLFSVVLVSVHLLTYQPIKMEEPTGNPDHPTKLIYDKMCDLITCRVHDTLFMIEISLFLVMIFISLVLIIICIVFLAKRRSEINDIMNDEDINEEDARNSYNMVRSSQNKLYFIPLINNIVWTFFFIYYIWNHIKTKKGLQLFYYPKEYSWVYSTFQGLRGLLYSFLLILTNNQLLNFFSCNMCNRDNYVRNESIIQPISVYEEIEVTIL